MSIIKLKNVSKFYYSKGVVASGFSKVNLSFKMGEFVAITGVSGSGKSTLLNVISGLDSYEEGEMYINGEETSHYSEKDFEDYRRKYIGNIFQNFNLVNSYTVYQNVELVLLLNGKKKRKVKKEILELLKKVNLYKFRNTKVSKLSGGQKQRVAIARALAKDTPIIIADEPTGSLDTQAAAEVIKLLSKVASDKLVIVVTHNYEQIEPYVTRQIKMHDGRILEDKTYKETQSDLNIQDPNYENITFLNKIRLAFRNTFNILPKFLLLLLVYLFVTVAIMSEYSSFKEQEYLESKEGSNYVFDDKSDKRIIIKKNDKTAFTSSEYDQISKLNNVDYIVKDDILLDYDVELTNNDYWFQGKLRDINRFDRNLDVGRMPAAADEIVMTCNKSDCFFDNLDDTDKTTLSLLNKETGLTSDALKLKVVGIRYNESKYDYDTKIYTSETIIEQYIYEIYKGYSTTNVLFMNRNITPQSYDTFFKIVPNERVNPGLAYITSDLNYECPKYNCINQNIKVDVNNIFYTETLEFKVAKTYDKKGIKSLLGITNYEENNGIMYISPEDYETLYHKRHFQSSVFIKDIKKIDQTITDLQDLSLNTLAIKDTLVKGSGAVITKIIRIVVTSLLVIVLFFISYFVIRIILKSRNKYFSVIRMLGATRGVSKELLILELFDVANIAFFSFMILIYLTKIKILDIGFIKTILTYLSLKDYIILYIVINLMSYLASQKFSKKLFKKSVMTTINEEV